MTRTVFNLIAIAALLLQATAWAGMVPGDQDDSPTDTAASTEQIQQCHENADRISGDAFETGATHHDTANPATRVHSPDNEDVASETSDEHCASSCACASFCAGVLGAPPLTMTTVPAVTTTAIMPSTSVAERRPDNPYRPPIAKL